MTVMTVQVGINNIYLDFWAKLRTALLKSCNHKINVTQIPCIVSSTPCAWVQICADILADLLHSFLQIRIRHMRLNFHCDELAISLICYDF
jgi:hypothetical protein